jgi:hypothetical protein
MVAQATEACPVSPKASPFSPTQVWSGPPSPDPPPSFSHQSCSQQWMGPEQDYADSLMDKIGSWPVELQRGWGDEHRGRPGAGTLAETGRGPGCGWTRASLRLPPTQ